MKLTVGDKVKYILPGETLWRIGELTAVHNDVFSVTGSDGDERAAWRVKPYESLSEEAHQNYWQENRLHALALAERVCSRVFGDSALMMDDADRSIKACGGDVTLTCEVYTSESIGRFRDIPGWWVSREVGGYTEDHKFPDLKSAVKCFVGEIATYVTQLVFDQEIDPEDMARDYSYNPDFDS